MDKQSFDTYLAENADKIELIRVAAHKVHSDVNQHYDRTLPYGFHLDRVVEYVKKYAAPIVESTEEIAPLIFGAYFHDSIEDARLTYNNVRHLAAHLLGEDKATMATEIVYALTNEKGRTRSERANDKYYQGIRTTPYAPLCKFADRLANISYSIGASSSHNSAMHHVYAMENPHFISMITRGGAESSDGRLTVPEEMVNELQTILGNR